MHRRRADAVGTAICAGNVIVVHVLLARLIMASYCGAGDKSDHYPGTDQFVKSCVVHSHTFYPKDKDASANAMLWELLVHFYNLTIKRTQDAAQIGGAIACRHLRSDAGGQRKRVPMVPRPPIRSIFIRPPARPHKKAPVSLLAVPAFAAARIPAPSSPAGTASALRSPSIARGIRPSNRCRV